MIKTFWTERRQEEPGAREVAPVEQRLGMAEELAARKAGRAVLVAGAGIEPATYGL